MLLVMQVKQSLATSNIVILPLQAGGFPYTSCREGPSQYHVTCEWVLKPREEVQHCIIDIIATPMVLSLQGTLLHISTSQLLYTPRTAYILDISYLYTSDTCAKLCLYWKIHLQGKHLRFFSKTRCDTNIFRASPKYGCIIHIHDIEIVFVSVHIYIHSSNA